MVKNKVAPAVGIDLGTTFSCVGVWQDGRVEIITNSAGNRITPSYVGFTPHQRLVGDAAKIQAARNAENTVFDAKRLIGRKYSDAVVQEDMRTWPFAVVKGAFDKPMVSVLYKGHEKTLAAEDISSQVLTEMKSIAEEYLDARVTKAVITVPAYFNDAQRQATKDAGQIAGLEVLRIINEPTAAALAYGLQKQSAMVRNVLIFDVGGGTCDVSVLRIEDDDFRVLATDGDTHLGGEDFDSRLVEDLAEEFKSRTGINPSVSPKALRKLRTAAEVAKRTLSTATTADIEVDALHNGVDYYTSMTRTRMEDLCSDLFQKCIDPVRSCLKESGISPGQIAEVVLVGGSTRIPKIQELLQEVFPGKALYKGVNADEAVAQGAAIQAAVLTQQDSCPVVQLHDVTPLSLGIDTAGGMLSVLIPRNTPIPHTAESVFTNAWDNTTSVCFPVHEGQRKMSKDNHLLDTFSLSGLPPEPRGKTQYDVKMHIDADGILSVSANHRGSDNWKRITVKSSNGRMSQEEMACMVMDAEIYRKEDQAAMKKVTAKRELEDYTYNLRDALQEDAKLKSLLGQAKKQELLKVVKQTLEWLQFHDLADVQEYDARKQVLEKKLEHALPDSMSGYSGGETGKEREKLKALLRAMANL